MAIETQSLRPLRPNLQEFKCLTVFGLQFRVSIAALTLTVISFFSFQDPSVGLFFSGKRVMLLLLMMVIGMLPFIPLRETHYEVFLPLSIKRLDHKTEKWLPLFFYFIKKIFF